MKRHFFFDLDGTLADTDRDIREAWKATLKDLGLDCPHFESEFVAGPPIEDMVRTLFPERFTPELAATIRAGFARHYDTDGYPNTVEYPGVLDAVRTLKTRGDHVAIVTNKRYVGAVGIAKKFGWDTLFDGIYAGDMDVTLGVPGGRKLRKTELLARLISELGADPKSCTMIGDTTSDFEAAAYCGITSLGVAWGYGRADELAMASRVIRSAEEIIA